MRRLAFEGPAAFYVWMNLMGADAGILSTTVMDGGQPLDGDALRRDLTALARSSGGDRAALRKAALATIRTAFLAARERVKVLLEVLGGAHQVDLQLTADFKQAPLGI